MFIQDMVEAPACLPVDGFPSMNILIFDEIKKGDCFYPQGEERTWHLNSNGKPTSKRRYPVGSLRRKMSSSIFSIPDESVVSKWMRLRIPTTKLVIF